MVRASKVLGIGKRGWFCHTCADHGGRPMFVDGAKEREISESLFRLSEITAAHGVSHDWLSCNKHADCAELVAYCEEKHDRYGEILFPR